MLRSYLPHILVGVTVALIYALLYYGFGAQNMISAIGAGLAAFCVCMYRGRALWQG